MHNKNLTLAAFCFLTLAGGSAWAAGDHFKPIHVDELSKMMDKKSSDLYVFDANNAQTRGEFGTIPGSKLLASYHDETFEKALPSDKSSNLVFFCANTKCMASHEAANRAAKDGYSHVFVMVDGIQGWKKAGKPTDKAS